MSTPWLPSGAPDPDSAFCCHEGGLTSALPQPESARHHGLTGKAEART
eukprot:CAMPEP_0181271388 /NCGR_PEP_ID=MMETSP1097-20121128/7363_1 /TAXON_ID=35684 /ORGANISM="Pseudopedinella elastica, Strain CCMP716" /LENGTH=47 /DNA_ID= /DNA_START= /DNA_END= /DNA_ORIENTATION=